VLALASQGFFGEFLVSRANGDHRAALPLGRCGGFGLVLLVEALLVCD
jgi:hypothetical protein